MTTYKLWGRAGWGSSLVEAQLAWYGLPFTFEPVGDLLREPDSRVRLQKVNPLAQVPTLVLPDGSVMSESAAITLLLADITGQDSLVPKGDAPERAAFLRWLVFIVANIYPTFTYADVPGRFVPGEKAAKDFRANVDDYQKKLWSIVEAEAKAPWFLGERFSALDVYLAIMTRWRPNRPWFEANAPKLVAAADRCSNLPKLKPVLLRNYP